MVSKRYVHSTTMRNTTAWCY